MTALFESEYNFKVPFYDVDMMGVVWHGNYIKYIEDARCDMFSKIGYDYMDMKDEEYVYPIAKMETKYIKPAIFQDELTVKCLLKEIEPAIIIKYTIYNGKNRIFQAETMQIAIDAKTRTTIYKAPERLKELLK